MHPFEQTLKRVAELGLLTAEEESQMFDYFLDMDKRLHPKTLYMQFIDNFNTITGKRYRGDSLSREQFYKASYLFSSTDIEKCIKNAHQDPYLIVKDGILTPSYITRDDMLAKYINYKPPIKEQENGNNKPNFNEAMEV